MPRLQALVLDFICKCLDIQVLVLDFIRKSGWKKTKAFAYKIYSHFTQQCSSYTKKPFGNGNLERIVIFGQFYHSNLLIFFLSQFLWCEENLREREIFFPENPGHRLLSKIGSTLHIMVRPHYILWAQKSVKNMTSFHLESTLQKYRFLGSVKEKTKNNLLLIGHG